MNLIRLFNTLKYLKAKQIYYRLFYFARARLRRLIGFRYEFSKRSNTASLKLIESIDNRYSIYENKKFEFLNLEKKFEEKIDWNYTKFGKLWTYNLTYFEYLKYKENVDLIYDFIENIENIKDGLEPFPISLRAINWIKFLTKFKIKYKDIDDSLYAQYYILLDNLEYHLLGNHLLENGFSLLFGAYYFEDEKLYKKAKNILINELNEQVLNDGAHFELSPMYHQIMLFRIFDCINVVKNNKYKNQELLVFLEKKASLMLGWLENISYKNKEIPLLNDSANKIAPTTSELIKYANSLKIKAKNIELLDSGYRKIVKKDYECVVDAGKIGSDYIPGHAHADTFNFELYIKEKPFIVDSGLSTYDINETRFYQRATKAHNTIEVNDKNSSEVWGGFRVADRAVVLEMSENDNHIIAVHDGYKKRFGVSHKREWIFERDRVIIKDILDKDIKAVFRLHFHPDVNEENIKNKIKLSEGNMILKNYDFANEFNKTKKAIVLEIEFKREFQAEIYI